ncbi:MAG: 30S ribosomal protein S20 [Gammaproteobacteria bacterium]|jgi:small subunit ribosomal protein S20
MANSQQAERRARQAENQRKRNVAQRSMMRTYIKKVVKALDSGDRTAAEAAYQAAVPIVDRMANRGLIHKNKAARHKSRLNARIRVAASPGP